MLYVGDVPYVRNLRSPKGPPWLHPVRMQKLNLLPFLVELIFRVVIRNSIPE